MVDAPVYHVQSEHLYGSASFCAKIGNAAQIPEALS